MEDREPPLRLRVGVACMAAGTLILEIQLTRIFSVLFYYHFTFFAVALAMCGLAFGGLWMARRDVATQTGPAFEDQLARLALIATLTQVVPLLVIVALHGGSAGGAATALIMVLWLPAFSVAGAFLAGAFARRPEWISSLYAWDLIAAAGACLAAVPLLRSVEGPAALTVPALLAAVAGVLLRSPTRVRVAAVMAAAGLATTALIGAAREGPLLRLAERHPPAEAVVFERWNEHSRVQGRLEGPNHVRFVIDRSAATNMARIPAPAPGAAPTNAGWWAADFQSLAFHVGRPLDAVAVIGVGGGADLLAPLARGASRITGYELNRTFVDLLARDFRGYNALANRPEVELRHAEARTALERETRRFDVIQASLIDTWAATAAGGLVLSENGLYTLEGWATFLDRLTPTGILTMTRWYLPDAPAETERLVALAAEALERAGIPDARRHVLLAAAPDPTNPKLPGILLCNILVSRTPFSAAEVARVRNAPVVARFDLLADPGAPPDSGRLAALLNARSRAAVIAASRFDISPPTDLRPHFFLQVRPRDFWSVFQERNEVWVSSITFGAVRVLFIVVAMACTLAAAVLWLSRSRHRDARATPSGRPIRGYFLAIGMGYMLVQLGLHQRLTLLLGHPTYALSVILFAMLLGTGLGAALSPRLAPRGRELRAWVLPLVSIGVVTSLFPLLPHTAQLPEFARQLALGGMLLLTGASLGTAFPVGVRLAAPLGAGMVQRMWAINGAASIAGTAVAALIGLAYGSRTVVLTGLGCYLIAGLCGSLARSAVRGSGATANEAASRPAA